MTVLDIALAYLRAGLSCVPVKPDGSKAPTVRWQDYQERPATEKEARRWWAKAGPGIAIVAGEVSGGLEVLDFDADALNTWEAFAELVERQAPGLLARLPRVETPGKDLGEGRMVPGFHLYYRCPDLGQFPGNTKLAQTEPRPDPRGRKPRPFVLIETRGQGGYVLAPGCPPKCHPTGRSYRRVAGPPLVDVPAVTVEERETLIACARSLNRYGGDGPGQADRPGDAYNRRVGWHEVLTPHGWQKDHQRGDVTYWRRPDKGKGQGWSATTGHCKGEDGGDLLYVFSSNAHPFADGKSYSKFAAYALLNHNGDFAAASSALRGLGFGVPSPVGPAPGRNGHAPAPVGPFGGIPGEIEMVGAAELLKMALPAPRWAVEGIIPEGLTVLVGPPKLGKSFLALNVALAVAGGGRALGSVEVEQGEVLYLALEDTKRRLQSRLAKMLAGGGCPAGLQLVTRFPRMDCHGALGLGHYLDGHPAVRLVLIDTWQRWRPIKKQGRDGYEEDYEHAAQVKRLADSRKVAVVLIHHDRKMQTEDPVDSVSGTRGLTGAADGIAVLRRERGQADATLFLTGRDIEEQTLALTFDRKTCAWSLLGAAEDFRRSHERQAILQVLRAAGAFQSPTEVAGLVDKPRGQVKALLWKMLQDGEVRSDGRGRYGPVDHGNAVDRVDRVDRVDQGQAGPVNGGQRDLYGAVDRVDSPQTPDGKENPSSGSGPVNAVNGVNGGSMP